MDDLTKEERAIIAEAIKIQNKNKEKAKKFRAAKKRQANLEEKREKEKRLNEINMKHAKKIKEFPEYFPNFQSEINELTKPVEILKKEYQEIEARYLLIKKQYGTEKVNNDSIVQEKRKLFQEHCPHPYLFRGEIPYSRGIYGCHDGGESYCKVCWKIFNYRYDKYEEPSADHYELNFKFDTELIEKYKEIERKW